MGADTEPRAGLSWRPIAVRLVLLGGLALAVALVAPELPRDQTVVFRLGAPVSALEASWTRAGQAEPTGGVTLTFPGNSPRRVRHEFSCPNGDYSLEIRVKPRTGGPDALYSRRVTLSGHETVVPLLPE